MRRTLTSLLIISLAACGGDDDSDALDADENTAVSSNEGALTAELTDESDAAAATSTAEEVAQAAVARIGSHLSPAGCFTTTVNGAAVDYTFVNCTGPRGLATLNGTIHAVYSTTGINAVHAVLTGTDFHVNQTTLNLNATIDATKQGAVKRAEIAWQTTGTGPRGNTVSRAGDYTVSWDSATSCFTLDGTTGSSRLNSTVVTDFKRCEAKCPESGTVVHTGARGNTVTLVYNGSASAAWSTSTGRSGTLNLKCAAN